MNPEVVVSISVSSFALAASISAAIFVFLQLRYFIKQAKFNSFLEVIRANREIITLGIRNPDLFSILRSVVHADTKFDPEEEKRTRYSQLWIDQANLMWEANQLGIYSPDVWEADRRDILEMFKNEEFRKRWEKVSQFYPKDFKEFVSEAFSEQ